MIFVIMFLTDFLNNVIACASDSGHCHGEDSTETSSRSTFSSKEADDGGGGETSQPVESDYTDEQRNAVRRLLFSHV